MGGGIRPVVDEIWSKRLHGMLMTFKFDELLSCELETLFQVDISQSQGRIPITAQWQSHQEGPKRSLDTYACFCQ
jgi:hypothetical protein